MAAKQTPIEQDPQHPDDRKAEINNNREK